MTTRSMYATQDEDDERGDCGEVAALPQIPKELLDQLLPGR